MKRNLIIFFLLIAPPSVFAQTLTIGWNKQPNETTMQGNGQDLCPPNNYGDYGYNFDTLCHAVYDAWTSGVYDPNSTDGPRFLIFGGGHGDYLGTEIYSIDIRKQKMMRLTNPEQPPASCAASFPDGTPNISAHTYGGPFIVPSQNKLYIWARLTGTTALNACGTFDMWALELSSINESCAPSCKPSWKQLVPRGLPTTEVIIGSSASYNPADGKVYVLETFNNVNACSLSRFDPIAISWTKLGGFGGNCAEYISQVVDPVRRASIWIGNSGPAPSGTIWMDISSHSALKPRQTAIDPSCATLAASASPALTWDSTRQQVVAYTGRGGTIYIVNLNPAANAITCVSESYGSKVGEDIPEPIKAGEIFNKMMYNAADDNYILSDNSDKTAWILKRPAP